MAGKNGDRVRTDLYDPQLMGRLEYASNPTRNRLVVLERFYLTTLTEMAANRFTWHGLPEGMDQRFLELGLLQRGLMVFFKETDVYNEFLIMRGGSNGILNVYDNPTGFQVVGGTGEYALNLNLTVDECVPIWANYLRTAEMLHIQMWATRLADIDRTIEISFKNARQTKIVAVPEDLRLAAVNTIKAMMEGTETVFGEPEMQQIANSITTLDLESHPNKLMNLLIAKSKVWNEIMTYMGVSNTNEEKKERMVVDEVNIKDEQIDLIKEKNLATRRFAAKQIGEMWPELKGITVEFNQSADALIAGADQGGASNAIPINRPTADFGE